MSQAMNDSEVQSLLSSIPGWELHEGCLKRTFGFDNFVAAFGWMAQVALLAEKADHHPDWKNVYNRVEVSLSTHDAGGITKKDFALAEQMNRCLK